MFGKKALHPVVQTAYETWNNFGDGWRKIWPYDFIAGPKPEGFVGYPASNRDYRQHWEQTEKGLLLQITPNEDHPEKWPIVFRALLQVEYDYSVGTGVIAAEAWDEQRYLEQDDWATIQEFRARQGLGELVTRHSRRAA